MTPSRQLHGPVGPDVVELRERDLAGRPDRRPAWRATDGAQSCTVSLGRADDVERRGQRGGGEPDRLPGGSVTGCSGLNEDSRAEVSV